LIVSKELDENLQMAKRLHQTAAELRREAEALVAKPRDLTTEVEHRWAMVRPASDEDSRRDTSPLTIS